MSASVTGKKQCVTCSKSGGIMTCDGCQQSFCGKHSTEHRQKLANQLDGIVQEHDLLQQELGRPSVDSSLLKQINKWEQESITKIQVTAEVARADLRQLLDTSNRRISKACHDIAVNLRSSREADDFSENDLNRWIEQLKALKLEFVSPPSIKLIEHVHSAIPLIKIEHNSLTDKQPSVCKNSVVSIPSERFWQVFGYVTLEEEGTVARHVGHCLEYGRIVGERYYSQGRRVIRFKIEYEDSAYNLFAGCISSRMINSEITYSSSASVGWFGQNRIYRHGKAEFNNYDSSKIKTNDILSITFDCEKHQIEFYHERINQTYKLQVDTGKAPLPWQLLVVLDRPNDCVRILPDV